MGRRAQGRVIRRPGGLLFDYGGTLVEEVAVDLRAGTEVIFARAASRPAHVTLDAVIERAERLTADVAARRDRFQIETPWTSLNRLIHDYFGTRFAEAARDLELAFWDASVTTRAMPGALDALREFHRLGIPLGVVGNSSFGQHVIRHELAKHGLHDHLAFIVVSAEYAVRKPNPLLFETASAMLGVSPASVWFVGDSFENDVVGARASGMTAVWFAPTATEHRDGADLIVRSWDEIVNEFRKAPE